MFLTGCLRKTTCKRGAAAEASNERRGLRILHSASGGVAGLSRSVYFWQGTKKLLASREPQGLTRCVLQYTSDDDAETVKIRANGERHQQWKDSTECLCTIPTAKSHPTRYSSFMCEAGLESLSLSNLQRYNSMVETLSGWLPLNEALHSFADCCQTQERHTLSQLL